MHQSETDMIERIFTATNDLMATVGLPNLSMHKIAKEAKISPGTIYIYFKNKDELLTQFARYIFRNFQDVLKDGYDEKQPFFQQYRRMWWNIWHFLESEPTIMANMGQYESLPGFSQVCREWENTSVWFHFCEKAKEAGELCDLPAHILFAISLASALNIADKNTHFSQEVSTEMLESVIERTWRAVKNQ
ncbi:TetR/AcrR family transcriptional regulator [Aggregatibacter kilianii]|uniref:TetR/AcrR family transcriptional regulator n=1 Tax=Aggregatibacter kilianii TaxID=2025884 RepID=UPI000D642E8C|nr:TetR/AcrR family transcriptional regulator [Aggregatibacter kilianii]